MSFLGSCNTNGCTCAARRCWCRRCSVGRALFARLQHTLLRQQFADLRTGKSELFEYLPGVLAKMRRGSGGWRVAAAEVQWQSDHWPLPAAGRVRIYDNVHGARLRVRKGFAD